MTGDGSAPILVTGATGQQGGEAALALLARGLPVRALVRDPSKAAARVLADAGAALVCGDLEDPAALRVALLGARGLFSVQLAPYADPDSERRQAGNLFAAARGAGVEQLVHTSVSGTREHRSMAGWAEGRRSANYWESKTDVEDAALAAGFASVTILKPAFMMDNFARPKAPRMFPDLARGQIVTATFPDTRISLVAARDVGLAAAAAFAEPSNFAGAAVELAGDLLSFPEMAAGLTAATGHQVEAISLPAEQVIARGQSPGWVESQRWFNEVGYPARPDHQRAYGLTPTSFADWAQANARRIGA